VNNKAVTSSVYSTRTNTKFVNTALKVNR